MLAGVIFCGAQAVYLGLLQPFRGMVITSYTHTPCNISKKLLLSDVIFRSKAFPLHAWTAPLCCKGLRLPEFLNSQQMKEVRLSVLRTGRLYPTGYIPGTHFYWSLSRSHGHSVAGRITSMKNHSDTIGNRTCHLPACSAVPKPTATLRTPMLLWNEI
jgi:hypothetical protein